MLSGMSLKKILCDMLPSAVNIVYLYATYLTPDFIFSAFYLANHILSNVNIVVSVSENVIVVHICVCKELIFLAGPMF
jgi:hypothetical protein